MTQNAHGGISNVKEETSDIDRGWAFVVMFSGCLAQILTLGLSYSSSIFYTAFLEEFEESPSLTAWTLSLNGFMFFISMEMVEIVIGCIGPRMATAIGCVLSTVGLLSCYFATSLITILVMYGGVTGVGFAFGFLPVLTVIPTYFKKYRVLAFGFAGVGSGVGQILYAPLVQAIMDVHLWRGAFLILTAINLHILLVIVIIRPPRSPDISIHQSNDRKPSKYSVRECCRRYRLLRNVRWLLHCLGFFLINVGLSAFFTHIVEYGILSHLPITQAAFLPSVIGIGSVFGRIVFSIVGNLPRVNIMGLYTCLFSLLGLVSLFIGFLRVSVFGVIVLCCAIFGIGVSGFSIYPESIIHIVGVENFSTSFAFSSLLCAVGLLLGAPLAASLYERDPSYQLSFLVTGVLALVGASLNIPAWLKIAGGRIRQRKSADDNNMKVNSEDNDGDHMIMT